VAAPHFYGGEPTLSRHFHLFLWTAESEELPGGRGLRLAIALKSSPASFADVIQAWRNDGGFRSLFNSLLAGVPYSAFCWETPPVTEGTLSQPFECVILDSPSLARQPDREAFAEHFENSDRTIAVFPNLGGDAVMVVPRPVADASAYGHLAAFVRLAPDFQRDELWRAVGEAMAARVGARPVWLSTAGAGVSWLHVRLDDRPKYYGYGAYCQGARS
jgi:hypothetical protein